MKPTRKDVDNLMASLTNSEKIAILESLGKKYRRLNSIRINDNQMGRRVEERPDELQLKEK